MKKKLLLITFLFSSISAFPQNPDVKAQSESSKETNGTTLSVRQENFKKKKLVIPSLIGPATSNAAANCVDNLGAGSGSNYTACQAGKKDR